jgi:hypothetical protein
MPDRETCRRFMASRLSLGTRIRCQSLRLRRPLRALEIDSLHGQAGGSSLPRKRRCVPLVFATYETDHYLFDANQTNNP